MSTALRAQWAVGRYGAVLAAGLLIIGLLGVGTAVMAYNEPRYEQRTTQAYPQTISTDVSTRVVVSGNSTLYEQGEVLEDNPAYLLSWNENVTITIETQVPADVETQLTETLVLEMEGRRDGETFWEDELEFVNRTRRVSGSAEPTTVRINIPEIESELAEVRGEAGRVGVFDSRLRLTVSYSTNRYSGSYSATAPLQITDSAYWIGGALGGQESHTTTMTERIEQPPPPSSYLVPGVGGLIAIVLGGVVLVSSRRIDQATVQTAMNRLRYEEWISSGEFPTGPNKRHIKIKELEDLVDVAIDSNKRVIYDDDYQAFAVADGDLVYYYAENPAQVEGWLDV